MPNVKRFLPFALILSATLGGCGLGVPEKDLFINDYIVPGDPSPQGKLEESLVANIKCEIRKGVYLARTLPYVAYWLDGWGATVTLKIQVEDQSGLNPGVTVIDPLENATKVFRVGGNFATSQLFNLGIGATGTAHATRNEQIAFTYSNQELLDEAAKEIKSRGELSCDKLQNGVMIQSDLKIAEFIYDKATIASTGEAQSTGATLSPFSTFSEDIIFVAAFGGNVTPTWKFLRTAVDANTTLLSATRTSTNDLIISLGKVAKPASKTSPAELEPRTQAVHEAGLIGSSTALAIQSLTH